MHAHAQFNFFKELQSVETLKQRNWETTPTDARTVVDLLIDQIEFANGTGDAARRNPNAS